MGRILNDGNVKSSNGGGEEVEGMIVKWKGKHTDKKSLDFLWQKRMELSLNKHII